MGQAKKQFEGMLGAWALAGAQSYLMRKAPHQAERIGERLGRLIFKLAKKRRQCALRNLELAFPEWSQEQRFLIAGRSFEHFGRVTADFLASKRRTTAELDQSMQVEGIEHLDEALAQGKGVLLITGHFGNWERMSAWLSTHDYKITVIARDTRSAQMNKLVQDLREGPGTEVIARGDAARPTLERLRRNELIGILPDQNTDEIFVPFFGKPAGTVLGPGVLSERTGAPVVPCWCVWTGPAQYRMTIEPVLEPEEGYTVKGEGMIRAINASLERTIRRHPEQWLWMHDRWRSARRTGLI